MPAITVKVSKIEKKIEISLGDNNVLPKDSQLIENDIEKAQYNKKLNFSQCSWGGGWLRWNSEKNGVSGSDGWQKM